MKTISEFSELISKALKGEEMDFTTGKMSTALFLLAVPMIIEMIMESLFAIVDVFFVAKISNEAVATVGLTESVLMIIESVAIGLSMAVTAMVARRIGEKNEEEASHVAAQSMFFGAFLALLIGFFCYQYADKLLYFMGAETALVEQGRAYTSIILGFNIVLMMLFIHNAIFRSSGNPVIAMRSLWIANGINIILDPCLIFGLLIFPELGLTGAAIASTIGRGVGVLYQLYHLNKGRYNLKIRWAHFTPSFSIIKQLVKLSIGGAGQFLISTASWIFLLKILASFGSGVLAGYTIAIRIIIFTILPSWGLANATATLVGQNLGANQPARAEKTVWLAAKYNLIFMLIVSIVFFTFADFIVQFFTEDQSVIDEAVLSLKIICSGYIFYAYEMTIGNSFNGAGDTYTPTMINFICFWLIQIPLAYFLSGKFGSAGVYWSIAISSSISAIMSIVIFRMGRWKKVRV